MLEAIGSGLLALLTPQALLFMLIGILYGLVIGILPGLGGVVAMTLLLPFTYGHEVAATLALLLGAHIATLWGDSVTSILFNVPGSSKSLALVFDGYPMTLRGEGERALGASAMAVLLGGIIGAIFLAACIPFVRPIILALGPAEYLMVSLWGMTLIATFSAGSLFKGLTAAALGVLIAFIGMDPVTATPRYTFGVLHLLDGISFPVAMIGLFAVSEMMKLHLRGDSIVSRQVSTDKSSVWDGVWDTLRRWPLVVRSSVLGLWIGVLPGVGGSAAGIAAYAQAVQTSKHPETFGTGNVEGVIAPDATLGANEGGGLLPTLAFGIPGGDSMALLLIAFINMGIAPGPQMLTNNLGVVFSLVWIIVLASVITAIIGISHLALPRADANHQRRPDGAARALGLLLRRLCHAGRNGRRARLRRLRRPRLSDGEVPLFAGQPRHRHGPGHHDRAQPACVADDVRKRLHLHPPADAHALPAGRADRRLALPAPPQTGEGAGRAREGEPVMSRRAQENLVGVIVLAVFVVMLYLTFGYSSRARLVPLPVCIFGIILAVAQLLWQNLRSGGRTAGQLSRRGRQRGTINTPAAASQAARRQRSRKARKSMESASRRESSRPSASSPFCWRWCSWSDRCRRYFSSPRVIWP